MQQRMCCIALRHLSGIQKAIQSFHAGVEYSNKYANTPEYKRWARKDKTLIILEANTSQQLEEAFDELKKAGVRVAKFHEPDISDSITAIAFLLPETVWNTQKYPDGKTPTDLTIRRVKNKFNLATN